MALHQDLLEVARYLLRTESPTQATLRRSVSTAYYALFHLLIYEACANWTRPEQRSNLARAFSHKQMFTASDTQRVKFKDAAEDSTENRLLNVGLAFVQLQQKREFADYDYGKEWSLKETGLAVRQAENAFKNFDIVRNEQVTQDYLFSLLIRERAAKFLEWGER